VLNIEPPYTVAGPARCPAADTVPDDIQNHACASASEVCLRYRAPPPLSATPALPNEIVDRTGAGALRQGRVLCGKTGSLRSLTANAGWLQMRQQEGKYGAATICEIGEVPVGAVHYSVSPPTVQPQPGWEGMHAPPT
jgi:hypothetical protein